MKIQCPNCWQRYEVTAEHLGITIVCQACGNPFVVASPNANKRQILKADLNRQQEDPQRRGGINDPKKTKPKNISVMRPSPPPGINAPKKAKSQIRTVTVLAVLVIFFVGNFHIITGKNVGFRIVGRDSFGFDEFFINQDAIVGMPNLFAKGKYPIGVKVLQREGLIESDRDFERRTQADFNKKLEEAQREVDREMRRIMKQMNY